MIFVDYTNMGETVEQTLLKYVKPRMTVKGDVLVAKQKAGVYYSMV
jgi:hypothetical protein